MKNQYIERRNEDYWIVGTRVSLDSIVYAFLGGQTAESIAQSFPVLTLEQVYGAITFYLANRIIVDKYLEKAKSDFENLQKSSHKSDPMFYQKLAEFRKRKKAIVR